MKQHLSSEAMEQALAGHADTQTTSHLESCASCAQEVTTLRQMLGAVRDGAVMTAERERRRAAAPRPRVAIPRWQGWALGACAVALLAVGVPVKLHRHAVTGVSVPGANAAQNAPGAQISDEALLNDVASDLSTSVPQPLAPLTVASNTASSSARSAD